MEELALLKKQNIESMIYEIRGKQVMLDSDLARLYQCQNGTKSINLAVKRHVKRFPDRFMFQLTREEFKKLRFQVETTNNMVRTMPYVFTEQGVAMLATVIRTKVAEEISIQIMDAFIMMKKYISTNLLEQKYINNQVMKNTEDIRVLQETFSKFEEKRKANEIFFEGQIYDAYSKILSIFKTAKKNLIVIDSYSDNTVLDMISKIKVPVTIITKEKSKISQLDIDKYNSQYNNLNLIYVDSFHDRYFIIDEEIIYHCGASINHAGKRAFGIDVIGDEEVKMAIINKIKALNL